MLFAHITSKVLERAPAELYIEDSRQPAIFRQDNLPHLSYATEDVSRPGCLPKCIDRLIDANWWALEKQI